MANRQVAIRFGTEGEAQVKATLTAMGDAGDAAAGRLKRAFERDTADAEAAIQRLANTQAKINAIMPQTKLQMQIGDANSTGFGQFEGSARASAAAFKDLIAAEEQLDARTRALLTAIDPTLAAQHRLNAAVGEAKALLDAGRISTEQYALANQKAQAQFDEATGATRRAAQQAEQLAAAEERLEARTRALLMAIDPTLAAQQRFSAAVADARELLDAGRISTDQFAQAQAKAQAQLDQATGATRRAAQAAEQLATMQKRVDAAGDNGMGGWAGSAERSAAAFAPLIAAQERLEARTRALVSAIDPAYAAQVRFDREIAEARDLISQGAISLDQYAAKLRQERGILDEVTEAQARHARETGNNKAAYAALGPQVQDAFTQISMGANPLNVLAVQGGQAAGQMLYMGGKMQAVAEFMLGPWGLALTGGLLLLGGIIDHLRKTGDEADKTTGVLQHQVGTVEALTDAQKLLDAAMGSSLKTQGQLRAEAIGLADANLRAAEGARQRAIQEITLARALLEQEKVRSRQGNTRSDIAALRVPDMMTDLDKREAALVALEAKAATTKVSRDRLVAEDARLRANETADRVDGEAKLLASAGRTGEAERALAKIREDGRIALAKGTITEAAYRAQVTAGEKALDAAREADRKHGAGREQSLARQASAMEVNAAASLDLARAYLIGGAAALRAEAARKGLTDATRKGIDTDAQVARQLQVMVGEQVANGAKSVAQLREETDARRMVLAQVAAGDLPIEQMNQALAKEALLRPLLKLQMVAQGEQAEILKRVISELSTAFDEDQAVRSQEGLDRALSASIGRAEELKSQLVDLNRTPLDGALNAARRAADKEADGLGLAVGSDDRAKLLRRRGEETEAQYRLDQRRYVLDTLRGQQDGLALATRELSLLGANDNYRSAEIEKLKIALDIRRRFPDLSQQDTDAMLRGALALVDINHQLDVANAAMGELRDFGASFVDDVLSEDTWSDWGSAGKKIIGDIRGELLKLALINPLKNMINGNDALPTLTSVAGNIGNLFGAGKLAAGGAAVQAGITSNMGALAPLLKTPAFAIGTEYAPGGRSLVGEFGPEIVDMPTGAKVTPAAQTRRLLSGNDNPVAVHIDASIHAPGADPAALARVEAGQREMVEALPGKVVMIVKDAQARGFFK